MYLKTDAYAVAKMRRYAAARTPEEMRAVLEQDAAYHPAGTGASSDFAAMDNEQLRACVLGVLTYLVGMLTREEADVTVQVENWRDTAQAAERAAAARGAQAEYELSMEEMREAEELYENFG